MVKVIEGQGQVKFRLAPIGLKLGENKPGSDGSMKRQNEIGQGQVKFHLAPIGLKPGENKLGCDGSMKRTLRTRLVKVSRSSKVKVRSNFILLRSGLNLAKINLDVTGV